MAEMKEILIFCAMYSGVMMGAMAYTLSLRTSPKVAPARHP